MRQTRSLASLLTLFVGIIVALSFGSPAFAQDEPDPPLPVYNPYPPGILPANVNSELARVLREIAVIENEAIGQWHALPPPTLTGQPPTLQGSGYSAVRILGKLMNFDRNISPLKNIACA
jgi:cytochrome c peroxidase